VTTRIAAVLGLLFLAACAPKPSTEQSTVYTPFRDFVEDTSEVTSRSILPRERPPVFTPTTTSSKILVRLASAAGQPNCGAS